MRVTVSWVSLGRMQEFPAKRTGRDAALGHASSIGGLRSCHRAPGAGGVDAPHLGLLTASDPEGLLASAAARGWTLRRLSDAYVDLVLAESGGNVAEAARRLGIARKTLYERMGSGLPSTLCAGPRRV